MHSLVPTPVDPSSTSHLVCSLLKRRINLLTFTEQVNTATAELCKNSLSTTLKVFNVYVDLGYDNEMWVIYLEIYDAA